MSLKKVNKKVVMNIDESNKLQKMVKEKEKKLKQYINANGNTFKIKKINKKYYFIRGSFEKSLTLKTTHDCDVDIFLDDYNNIKNILNDFQKIQSWKSQLLKYFQNCHKNQAVSFSETKPSIDIEMYKNKVLSIVPVIIFPNNKYKYTSILQKTSKVKWMETRKWDGQDYFNKEVLKFGKKRRKSSRSIVRIIKYLLKGSFQNLPTSPLEHYIIEKFLKNRKNLNYLSIFKEILKSIYNDKFYDYIDQNNEFKTFNFLDKNPAALKQIKNRSQKIYHKIKDCQTWENLLKVLPLN